MNEMKYQNLLQSLAKFMEKFTQLLASISLFSFLFSYYYSSYFSSFFTQYSLNSSSFSTFPFQLLSHAMDKNYVFLICNGIFLVLLANTSSEEEEEEEEDETNRIKEDGFYNEFQEVELPLCIGARASYLETSKEEMHVQREDHKEVSIQLMSKSHENSNMTIVEYKQDETTSEGQVLHEEKEEGGIGGEECSSPYDNYEEHEMNLENDFFTDDEEEEEEEVEESDDEPLNELSTEELNKKFEEFIRKMKEEIRIETRQQLVLVK